VQGLFVFLREELDAGDPVEVFVFKGEFRLSLQIPVRDAVVSAD